MFIFWHFSTDNIAVRYKANSFSQYMSRTFTSQTVPPVNRRRRSTETCDHSFHQHRRYQTDLRLQIRLEQNVTEGILFLATNAYGTEFHRVDVSKIFQIQQKRYKGIFPILLPILPNMYPHFEYGNPHKLKTLPIHYILVGDFIVSSIVSSPRFLLYN